METDLLSGQVRLQRNHLPGTLETAYAHVGTRSSDAQPSGSDTYASGTAPGYSTWPCASVPQQWAARRAGPAQDGALQHCCQQPELPYGLPTRQPSGTGCA